MKNEDIANVGTISQKYIPKEVLKTSIVLVFIFGLVCAMYMITAFFIPFLFPLFLLLTLTTAVLPVILVVICVYAYEKAYVRNFSYQISVDNIIINHGVFTKTRATIPYSRIQNINTVNGVFDRMFHLATVKIETAGSTAVAAGAQGGVIRPEGYIPALREPKIIEEKIKEMVTRYSAVPSGLEDKIFKPEELAFDNFISYILSKMREGEKLVTSIAQLREKADLTQAKLAEAVGVPVQTIEYLEGGKYNPSLTLAYKITQVLNCKIEDLFKFSK